MDFQQKIDEHNKLLAEQKVEEETRRAHKQSLQEARNNTVDLIKVLALQTKALAQPTKELKNVVAKSQDIDKVVKSVDKLATTHKTDSTDVTSKLDEVIAKLLVIANGLPRSADSKDAVTAFDNLVQSIDKLPKEYPQPEKLTPLLDAIESLSKVFASKDFRPTIKVDAPTVNVPDVKVDTKGISDTVAELKSAIKGIKIPEVPKTDLKPLIEATERVSKTLNNLRFPTPNYVLPFKNTQGAASQVQLDSSGNVPVSGTISVDTTGLATSTNQTNGNQKVQIVDAGGDAVTVTGSKLDVNATIDTTGLATSAAQTDKSQFTKITDGTDTALVTAAGEQNVIATAQPGVDIGDVTINNASGGSAVNIQDGGNSITVDGTVAVSGTVTVGSHAVTNAGTFAVQENGAALTSLQLIDDTVATLGTTTYTEASTKGNVIGAVRRDANTSLVDTTNEVAPLQVNATGELKVAQIQALPAGTNAIGKLAANDGVDVGDVTINNASGASAVNVQDGGNSLTVDYATTGSGTATGALRVELPTNGTGVIATVGAVTAITNALPAGTNAIGKLAANSGVDIGDVDVTSVIPGTAATNLGKAVDSATGSTDTGVAPLIKRVDTPTTVTPAANDYMNQHGDKYGNTYVSQGAFEVGSNFNAILNDVDISVKASAGYLKSIQVSSINAGLRYLQIHNKATAPAAADVPVFSFPISAGTATVPSTLSFGREDWGDGGYYCSIGVAIGISTTAATFTAATTTDHVVVGVYV